MPASKKKSETEDKVEIKTPTGKYFYGTGKRKRSVARVRIYKGSGNITINNRSAKDYCNEKTYIGLIKSPLKLTGTQKKYDVLVKVSGGGMSSQAEAIRHGVAKALIASDPTSKIILKKEGLVTRDSRTKERKKFGLKRARKAPQFSKR